MEAARATAQIDFETLQQQISDALLGLRETARAVDAITGTLRAAKVSASVGEQWVQTWGETINKKEAAKMLGVSVGYLNKLVAQGDLRTTPDGRIIVRAAAEWANGAQTVKKAPKTRFRV